MEDEPVDEEIGAVADELYAASPEEFVALRTERAAAARKAGDRTLANAVGALRRPTRSAWLVNVLAREAADDLSGLLDLGQALAEAQRSARGDELRRLSTQRNQAVGALVRRAAALGAEHGHQASEATRTEVSQTLNAALADPALAATVTAGHLTQAASYGGFGPDLVLSPGPGSAAPRPPADLDAHRRKRSAAERLAALTDAAEAAIARLDEARSEQQEAESAAAEAEGTVEAAEQAVEAARAELTDRESDLESAQAARSEAEERRDRAAAESDAAEQAAAAADAELKRSS